MFDQGSFQCDAAPVRAHLATGPSACLIPHRSSILIRQHELRPFREREIVAETLRVWEPSGMILVTMTGPLLVVRVLCECWLVSMMPRLGELSRGE